MYSELYFKDGDIETPTVVNLDNTFNTGFSLLLRCII